MHASMRASVSLPRVHQRVESRGVPGLGSVPGFRERERFLTTPSRRCGCFQPAFWRRRRLCGTRTVCRVTCDPEHSIYTIPRVHVCAALLLHTRVYNYTYVH